MIDHRKLVARLFLFALTVLQSGPVAAQAQENSPPEAEPQQRQRVVIDLDSFRPQIRCSVPLTRIPAPPGTDLPIEQVPPADPDAVIQNLAPPAPPCPEEAQGPGAQSPASARFSLGGGLMIPSLLTRVEPQYSEEAREAGIEGTVILAVVVQTDGTVEVERVVRGLGYGLDQNAIDAVSQWRFRPVRRNGQPVEVALNLEVTFSLRD